ncbi:ATP-binding cassette subfamily B protein [Faecalicoccus acidiformans]|uniref:ATP-binding cassette subfamily B protein n=1 Tax=Faecalicoccus acidiformans TaxID=915173 RepID=A0A7W8FXG0_9FIRM|nr:ABC transporter ATP-binding protein [Faecalicoccus acidiformans]MBB5184316.1 ATP-binding cassette subfamily B protein [Faecalicoccus acidiformans]
MSSLKILFRYSKGVRLYFVLSILFVAIETSFEVIIPLLMSEIIDVGIAQQDPSIFLEKGLQMILCAILSLLFGIWYAKCAAKAISLFCQRLRSIEFEKIQEYAFSNLDHFETASLITRLTSDITVIQNALINGIRPFARGPIILILGLVMSFIINARLAIIFLFTTPILGVILFLIVKKIAPMYRRLQQAVDRVNLLIQENLTAIRAVKAFVRDEYEEEQFSQVNEDLANITQNTFHFASFNTPAFQMTMYMAIVGLMLLGVNMIVDGNMQVGELTGVLSYVLQIMNSLMMISNVFLLITRSIASCNRIAEVIEEPVNLRSGKFPLTPKDNSVDFNHVFFKYHPNAKEYVLSDITWHIPSGSTVGILGATGSAKSSLVQLIPRLYDVNEGSVKIGHVDVRDMDLVSLRDQVAMVLQNNTLFSGTIKENMRWGDPNASDEEIRKACEIACADEFIQKFPKGYDTYIEQGGTNVSGGQRQRLCIARALLKKPRILILDDSTSAVDTNTDHSIRSALRSIQGLTQILIAQRVSSVIHCDQILILEDGKISAIGDHDSLMETSSFYRGLYESQQKGAGI